MTTQHPLFDAIDEMAESARHLTDQEAIDMLNEEIDTCIRFLQECKQPETPKNE